MKRCVFLALLFCCIAAPAVASHRDAGRIWISDVTIISPENLDHIGVGSVLIDDGRIVRVERGTAARAPAGATVISGKGEFLIPGLIDSHVHLASVPGVDPNELFARRKALPEMMRQYYEQLPRSYLYFGYTTLIDLAVVDRSVLDNFRHAPLHPDLYDCGLSLPVANGYPMSFAPPEVRFQLFPNWLLDPQHASGLPAGYDPEKHTPAAAVATVKSAGGICVKTYFERGFGQDRNLPVITPTLIAQVRQAAHQDNLVLMMHANSFEAQKFAVDAQVDVIAHGMWNWGDLDNLSELPPEIKALLDRIVQDKIGYQPTIQVMQGLRAYFDPAYLDMPAVRRVIPAKLLTWFQSPQGKWFKKELAGDNPQPDAAMREGYDRGPIRRVDQVVAYLAAKNARFLFGTDTPSAPTYGNLPGLNGYLEMQDLYRAGMSLPQILRAATIENARMFHLDSQVGTIEPGKIANLVLLRKSPLESTDAYNGIVTVFVHGKPISRDTLAAVN
ncbi:MAG TPA: amidohydrolase family protein [Tepidisphaeraceae bacterium]|nr:amidohydrolase family protein [Tepidisphaeraceae bacterium]